MVALAQQPVEVARPAEPMWLHHQLESLVTGETPTLVDRRIVRTVDAHDHAEGPIRLFLNRMKCLGNEPLATEDRHADEDVGRHVVGRIRSATCMAK